MLGAIIGDIVGSIYEWCNIKTKDFPLFQNNCFFTDDTVMTAAVADAVMKGGTRDDFIDSIKYWGRKYPDCGYGSRFSVWLKYDNRKPYNSWGNGSAMRVSPCAWVMSTHFCRQTGIWPTNRLAELSAAVTHNHPEGIKGALAVNDAIFICLYRNYLKTLSDDDIDDNGNARIVEKYKEYIKKHTEKEYGYDLNKTLDEIRPKYAFNESCQETVPQAVTAFLESTDFEDAIRNAISLGGDSDTLAAITGSIAEAAYGIPDWIRDKALSYLDAPLLDVYERWRAYIADKP
ncbi:MAG: ADP-ribosylglycohydrolase family protein [Clostridiales bacterium]|jgi:ADP-ribosylglycohydrolase|nr:ADP-ribosylglycohydrolase family protein [Clostridiales bacterium]